MKIKGFVVALVLFAVGTLSLSAQTSPTPTPQPVVTPVPSGSPAPAAPAFQQAKPYQKDEFPDWALDLRRGEIIAIGSFPLTFLFTGLSYDWYYFATHGYDATYAPWPAGSGTSSFSPTIHPQEYNEKNRTILIASASLSILIAIADWALGKWGYNP